MFGLTFEKLFVVALLAAVIIGPRRLPDYATRAAELLRRLATLAADTRQRVAEESDAVDWRSLDPRQRRESPCRPPASPRRPTPPG